MSQRDPGGQKRGGSRASWSKSPRCQGAVASPPGGGTTQGRQTRSIPSSPRPVRRETQTSQYWPKNEAGDTYRELAVQLIRSQEAFARRPDGPPVRLDDFAISSSCRKQHDEADVGEALRDVFGNNGEGQRRLRSRSQAGAKGDRNSCRDGRNVSQEGETRGVREFREEDDVGRAKRLDRLLALGAQGN